VSWWFGGRLRDVNSFNLPDTAASRDALVEKINSVALAGEVAGWMPDEPACHLAKRGDVAADWNAALAKCFGRIREVEPMRDVDLATSAAEFAARTTAPGLMIEDYRLRNRQRFQDGLWMQGIKGALTLVLIVLCGFFAYGRWLQSDLEKWKLKVRNEGAKYTNALSLKAKMQTLKKQEALKTAALNAWAKVSTNLPPELKFSELKFTSNPTPDGSTSRKLQIWGAVDSSNKTLLANYQELLTRMKTGEGKELKKLFSEVRREYLRPDRRSKNQNIWFLTCDFNGE